MPESSVCNWTQTFAGVTKFKPYSGRIINAEIEFQTGLQIVEQRQPHHLDEGLLRRFEAGLLLGER